MAARTWLVPLALAAASCGDTLVDRFAIPALLDLCGAGSNFCGGACVAESAASCGPSCADCSAALPANAGPVCTPAHACDFECNPGWLRAGGRCQRATAVAAGYYHTCALTAADGLVKCWGANDRGQLGDGTDLDSAVPVDVALPGAASAIATGYAHSCALVAGAIYCWGDNTTGELGDGTTTQRPSPVPVMGISGATLLAAGGDSPPSPYGHTCAVVAGAVWCWGWNLSGQLGNGSTSTAPVPVPVQVSSLSGATALATGGRHTCALAGGAAFCWGADESGQLGDGTTAPLRQSPVPVVSPLSGPTFIAAGQNHTCAASPGGLMCWGQNISGQVDGGIQGGTYSAPIAVPLGGGFSPTLAAGGRAHTCALEPPQNLKCFGANASGQLTGSVGGKVDVTLLAPGTASAVAAGGDHTCALTGDGGIQCWGANDRGQVGNGQTGPPVPIPAYVSGR